jgi:hypothetical protein
MPQNNKSRLLIENYHLQTTMFICQPLIMRLLSPIYNAFIKGTATVCTVAFQYHLGTGDCICQQGSQIVLSIALCLISNIYGMHTKPQNKNLARRETANEH